MSAQIERNQKVTLHISEQDSAGATLPTDEGTITWSGDLPDYVNLTPSADGTSCDVAGNLDGTTEGDTQVGASIQLPAVDNGDGTTTTPDPIVVAPFLVSLVGVGAPVAGTITADAPVAQ